MTRTIIITAIPASTPERLIFPLAPNNQFDTSFYNPGFTGGRASTEEVNQILTEIQAARQPIIAKLQSANCCFILFILFGMMATFGLTFYLVLTVSMYAFFFSFIAFFVLFIVASITFRSKIVALTQQSKAVAQQVIDKYSGSFSSRGLRWVLPMHFPRWIELHKDYIMYENPGQPIYMPPNQYQPAPIYPGQGQGQPQYQGNFYQNQPTGGLYHA